MELDIDDDLHRKLRRRADAKGFESAEEYSVTVLRTVIAELEDESPDVEDRLEDLGYLS